MWTRSSTLIWSLTILHKNKSTCSCCWEMGGRNFPFILLRETPFSESALDTQSSLALVLLQDKTASFECARITCTYPSGFQQTLPIHSQWNRLYKCLSHLTSSTSQEIFWSFSSIICSTYGQAMILTDTSNSKILEPKGLWMMPLAF